MNILQLTAHFRPNIGGVETHLDDLCKTLTKKGFFVSVLTYQPLQTKANWQIYEKEKNLEILRIPWIPNLFYKLVNLPILEFIYLLPGLFLVTPFFLIMKKINIIHAHGLVAGFVGVFWGKLFGLRVVISTHSIYNFPEKGLYRAFASFIFKNSSFCLGLSKQATDEIASLGVNINKVKNFTYWIDLEKFKKIIDAKKKLGWKEKFIVLFVGRLVPEKGVKLLLESVRSWDKNISLKIIGSGPLESRIKEVSSTLANIDFIEEVNHDSLPLYYSGSDILIVPSIHEEGFGRVILEALACGTPVIGAKRGAISEAMDETVGKLINVSVENIRETVNYFYIHQKILSKLAKNCRTFAERRYAEKNAETIIRAYQV